MDIVDISGNCCCTDEQEEQEEKEEVMKKKEYKHEAFVPLSFMIGIDDRDRGFPSMRDETGGWTNVAVFEKHCGFKPHVQRDASKEIRKSLTQQVREIENVPISGFKLVKVYENGAYHSDYFRDKSCVVLKDPRGWEVSIQATVLQSLLESNGFNLNDGELAGIELMYCWPRSGGVPFSVVVANDRAKKLQAATAEYVVGARETVFALKPSELEVGKVYSSKTSRMSEHLYMYLGKHDVFSAEAHLRAVMADNYDCLEHLAGVRKDISGEGKHVLYCIDSCKKDCWALGDNCPGYSPYFITSGLSKLFDKCEDVDLTRYTMHNDDSKPCTLENIRDDMAKSVLFNKIDFSKTHVAVADYQALEDVFAFLHDYDFPEGALKAFPFNDHSDGIFLIAGNGNYVDSGTTWSGQKYSIVKNFRNFTINCYSSYDNDSDERFEVRAPNMLHEWDNRCNQVYKKYGYNGKTKAARRKAFKELCEDIKPMWRQYVLCNGNEVPPHQNLQLNTRNAYYVVKK